MIDLVVAGGGPVGLAAALYARRAGLQVAVVEPRPAPIDKACGEGLMPAAVRALAGLGVRPAGRPFRGIRYVDRHAAGDGGLRRHEPGQHGLGVRRTVLHAALHDAAVAAGVDMVRASVDGVCPARTPCEVAGMRARYLSPPTACTRRSGDSWAWSLPAARPSRAGGCAATLRSRRGPTGSRCTGRARRGLRHAGGRRTGGRRDPDSAAAPVRRPARRDFLRCARGSAPAPAQQVRGAGPLRQRAAARVARAGVAGRRRGWLRGRADR